MPSEKRSRGRIISGESRPLKTARFGHRLGDEDENSANGGSDEDMSLDDEPGISGTASTNSNLDPCLDVYTDNKVSLYTSMKVRKAIIWPSSLSIVKSYFYYNLTPQEGLHLPPEILDLVSSRIFRPSSRDGSNRARAMPYLHLGLTQFLELQIFIFLPNLKLDNQFSQQPRKVPDTVLEKWTDLIFLPSLGQRDPRAPSSWRLANLYRHSPAWYDETIAPFPTYKIHNNQGGQYLGRIWESIVKQSMRHPEFQHPFLLFYSNGDCPQIWPGSNPDQMMRDFEATWLEHIDMRFVVSPTENLEIDFAYGNALEIKDLPMR